jgi:tRNA1Val (adenine37-N6)-methyltransferase
MPVGTDAVLLGSWVNVQHPTNILDIGTGCGLIALLLAQRFPKAAITALDLHLESVEEAALNFKNSPWPERLEAVHANILQWDAGPYDLIVSNPPYFSNGYPIANPKRAQARSQLTLNFEELWDKSSRLLKPTACLALVLPISALKQWQSMLQAGSWRIQRCCYVKAHAGKDASLVLVEITQQTGVMQQEILCIRENNQYSSAYLSLVRDFYLFA